MTDDFTDQFPYRLSDLPAPPPDEFDRIYPRGGFTPMPAHPLTMPEIVAAGFRLPRPRQPPIGPYPGPNVPPSGTPIPEAWRRWGPALGTTMQMLPRLMQEQLQLQVTPDSGAGRDAERERCLKAAAGSKADWDRFCDSIGVEENNVLGAQSAKLACRSKRHESTAAKIGWCMNQYGD